MAFDPETKGSVGEPNRHLSGEEVLWNEVVTQAIEDLRHPEERVRTHAEVWIFSPYETEDFTLACQYAGLDPAWVQRMATRAKGLGPKVNNAVGGHHHA